VFHAEEGTEREAVYRMKVGVMPSHCAKGGKRTQQLRIRKGHCPHVAPRREKSHEYVYRLLGSLTGLAALRRQKKRDSMVDELLEGDRGESSRRCLSIAITRRRGKRGREGRGGVDSAKLQTFGMERRKHLRLLKIFKKVSDAFLARKGKRKRVEFCRGFKKQTSPPKSEREGLISTNTGKINGGNDRDLQKKSNPPCFQENRASLGGALLIGQSILGRGGEEGESTHKGIGK